jgi:hypothetical protein
MNVLNVFVCFKPVGADYLYAQALMAESPQELLKISAPLMRAFEDLRNWTTDEMGGTVFNQWGQFFVSQIPADKVDEVTKFLTRWVYTTKTQFSVGIGNTPMECYLAMEASEKEMGQRVVIYSGDLESSMHDNPIEASITKSEHDLDFPGLDLQMDENEPTKTEAKPQDDLKGKTLEVLQQLKQQSATIGQLKETAPEAYAAVKGLIDVFLKIAQQTKETDTPESPVVKQ